MFASLGMPELLRSARDEDELFLPRLEPGWQGAALAVAGAALGEGWAILTKMGNDSAASAFGPALGWLALMLIFAGLLMQLTRFRVRGGWHLRLKSGQLEPQDVPGQAHVIENPQGYALSCVAGDRFRSVAIDLVHEERGRVARVFQTPARTRLKDIRACSELTDILAQRLGVERHGLKA